LDSVGGGGDQAERDLWRAVHVSKRMAQLRAILDAVDDDTAAKAGVRESFQALARAQRHDPRVVAELLASPQVGAWAATCLRLLTSGASTSPLWSHLAHLGAIAAVAALRADHSARVMVPVRAGAVHLPTFGRAFVASKEELVECVIDRGRTLLDGAPPVAWEPVRILRAFAGGVPLRVQLDDVDPYWSSFGMPTAARLSADELEVWGDRLAEAWRVLANRHPHRLDTMAAAIRCVVPVQQAGRVGAVSASSVDAPGAIALTEPVSPLRLAATLIHESQHYRLASLHDVRRLYTTPPPQLRYSPWRNDPRPLSGVVHGLMAFTGVADFWSRERTDQATELEYARHVRQLHVAHRVAAAAPDLTALGKAVVAALGATIDTFPVETGPADVRRIADDLVSAHEAAWRLRNIAPHQGELRAFRDAWRSGAPLPVDHSAPPEPKAPSGDNALTRVAMAWLENDAEVRTLISDTELFAKRFPGAAPRDVSLVAGDYRTTRDDALAGIGRGTADDHTWATLAVAHGRLCAEPTRSPLVRVPELVRAAFAELSPEGDLDPLPALLARYEAGTSTSDSMRR
jgi:HEXXH motif-containing protein